MLIHTKYGKLVDCEVVNFGKNAKLDKASEVTMV